jgi:hypothetical protein
MDCPVCYNEILADDIVNLGCNHIYCSNCIFTWICKCKTTCPMCRAKINDPDIITYAYLFGIENKLLYIVDVKLYDINVLSENEYDLVNEYVKFNVFLTLADLLLLFLTDEKVGPILNQIKPKSIKKLVYTDKYPIDENEEYHIFTNY